MSLLSVQSWTTGRPLNRTDGNQELSSGQKITPPTVAERCCTSTWEPLHLCGSAPLQLKLTVSLHLSLLKLFTVFISNICSGVAAVFEASSERKGKLLCFSSLFLMNVCAIVRVLKCPQGVPVGNSDFWSLLHQ